MRGKQHSNGKAVLAEVSDASSFLAFAGGLAGGCPALTSVDLSNNDIREGGGVRAIARMVVGCGALTRLDVSKNQLTTREAYVCTPA